LEVVADGEAKEALASDNDNDDEAYDDDEEEEEDEAEIDLADCPVDVREGAKGENKPVSLGVLEDDIDGLLAVFIERGKAAEGILLTNEKGEKRCFDSENLSPFQTTKKKNDRN
jgi:hypothetical protein